MKPPLGERIRRRLRRTCERALLRAFGRPLRCAACGRLLFRGIPLVWRGRVRLIGASEHNVRVAFASKTELELRHVDLDRCPTPDRPWVP